MEVSGKAGAVGRPHGGRAVFVFGLAFSNFVHSSGSSQYSSCFLPTELTSTHHLHQPSMWPGPGAKRSRDRQTEGRGRKCGNTALNNQLNFQSNKVKFAGYRFVSNHLSELFMKYSQRVSSICWTWTNLLFFVLVLFQRDWTLPSQITADCCWSSTPSSLSHSRLQTQSR